MNLQTHIPIPNETRQRIDYSSNVVILGSCFSENIGVKFVYFKFQSPQNPLGILFHPKAIERFITNTVNEKEYTEDDVFFLNERWHCFDAHSSLSSTSKAELLKHLNEAIRSTNQQLRDVSHLIITSGTSWVYRLIESGLFVANCHKVPQKKFLKELLSIDEITEIFASIISLVQDINPQINVIFTVSPVRHLKDGFIENQQSKAHLIAAIHQITDPRKKLFYFPGYEIVMDELRDYRFYREDMIHPNQIAINYIWEKFSESWIAESANSTMHKIESIQKRLLHKPFNPDSEQHRQFSAKLQTDIQLLQEHLSHISF